MINTATAIGFTIVFVATAAGAALVFFFGKTSTGGAHGAAFSGLAAGIMVAASVFSLLLPSIDGFSRYGDLAFLPTTIAFALGGVFLSLTDVGVRKIMGSDEKDNAKYFKPVKMFSAMSVHNIPEGLAVGVAFGSAALGGSEQLAALALAIGIAVQNFPEGAAVSIPLRSEGISPLKAFLLGAASGLVEPIAAIVGFVFSTSTAWLLPYVMAFAAGTMIFVVVEDMTPSEDKTKIYAWSFMIGFAIMMALDITL